jgi:hypothetical protein
MQEAIIVIIALAVGFASGWGVCTWRSRVLDRLVRELPLLGVVLPPEKEK